MDLSAAFIHLLNFAAPAAALALLLVPTSCLIIRNSAKTVAWWAQAAIVFAVGCAVLLAGLWLLGRDDKVLTYAALVLFTAHLECIERHG